MSLYVKGIPASEAAKQLDWSIDDVVHYVRTNRLLLSREDVDGMLEARKLEAERVRRAQRRRQDALLAEQIEGVLKWARVARGEITAHGSLGPDAEPGR